MAPCRFFVLMLYYMVMVLIILVKDLVVIITIALVSCMAGMTAFTCEIVSESEGVLCILAIIFFPITMMIGFAKACGELFCDIVPEMLKDTWQVIADGTRAICHM